MMNNLNTQQGGLLGSSIVHHDRFAQSIVFEFKWNYTAAAELGTQMEPFHETCAIMRFLQQTMCDSYRKNSSDILAREDNEDIGCIFKVLLST